jgi:heme o synthase
MSIALARPTASRRLLGYLELTKPRITLLVLMTAVPALLMASASDAVAGGAPPARMLGILFGIALASGSAAAFNHYYDRDLDARMRRTARRPLPSGLLPPAHALMLGFALGAGAWGVLSVFGNRLAAALGIASIVYYAVIYTVWLKRRTPQNIVIGGGAGASAPLIAWAALTGRIEPAAVLMAAIVFLWTPPHFWSLALYRREDYERAGLPMLPVTHGEEETRRQIVLYTLVLVPVTLALVPLGVAGAVYGVPAALLGAAFIALALRVRRTGQVPHAVRMFRYSIVYLFALFACLTADAALRAAQHAATLAALVRGGR